MLAVRHRRANHGLSEVAHRRIRRVARNAPSKPLRDFLQQPPFTVWIFERNKGPVTETLRVGAADADVDAWKPATGPGCTVKYLARVGAIRDQLQARSLDVGDDQEQGLGGTGRGRREVHAELD